MTKIKQEEMKMVIRISVGYPYDFTERVLKNKKPYTYEELLNDGFMVIYDIVGKEEFHDDIWKIFKEAMEKYAQGVLFVDEMPQDILNQYYEKIRKSGGLGDFPLRILQLLFWSHGIFSKKGDRGTIFPRIYDLENKNLPEGWFVRQYIFTNNQELFVQDIFHNIMRMHSYKFMKQSAQILAKKSEKIKDEKIDRIERVINRVDETTQEINKDVKSILLELVKNNSKKVEEAITKVLDNIDVEEKDKTILKELKKIAEISDWIERINFWYNKIKILSPIVLSLINNFLR